MAEPLRSRARPDPDSVIEDIVQVTELVPTSFLSWISSILCLEFLILV